MILRKLINASGKGHLYTIEQYITTDEQIVSHSIKRMNQSDTKLRMKVDEHERYERLLCGDTWIKIDEAIFTKETSKPFR